MRYEKSHHVVEADTQKIVGHIEKHFSGGVRYVAWRVVSGGLDRLLEQSTSLRDMRGRLQARGLDARRLMSTLDEHIRIVP